MPKISNSTYSDTIAKLPAWVTVEGQDDSEVAFIGAAGFEERCTRALIQSVKRIKRAFILHYSHNESDNKPQEDGFSAVLKDRSIPFVTSKVGPSLNVSLSEWLSNITEEHIAIDISSMASFAIYPVLQSVFRECQDKKLTIFYTSAEHYQPEKHEFEVFYGDMISGEHHLRPEICAKYNIQSAGVNKNYLYDIYQCTRDNRPGHAIILPNFSYDRVTGMMACCYSLGVSEPDVSFIIGSPAREEHRWITAALERLYSCPAGSVKNAGSVDYKMVMVHLREIWENTKDEKNLFIADLGSKAHHLGVFFFLLTHRDVGLVLSEPRKFSGASYSKGFTATQRLELGTLSALQKELSSWRTLKFAW
jgi:hypothetical protein